MDIYKRTQKFENFATSTRHFIIWMMELTDENDISSIYSGPCDLRPPIHPAKYGLKLKVVLK